MSLEDDEREGSSSVLLEDEKALEVLKKIREPEITIQNVVSSADIRQRLDLHEISKRIKKSRYDPDKFPGLVLKLDEPKAALLLFSSGKFVCTGTKSVEESAHAINAAIEVLQKHGIEVRGRPLIKAENIVASAKLHVKVDIERLALELENTLYEPEQFPGLIFRMRDPDVVFLIFASGSLVCTGAKKESDVRRAVYKLREILARRGYLVVE
ncbi:MAG: TATA-box-binding protein [Candidatus Korarchaeota archaeon NZ13-K]|nr:MAG: TATA-box-binding protein [Candidatus Korarchaeota archaeon NZ13-K]